MDNVPLHLAVGIDRANGFYKTLQAIHAEQMDVQIPLAASIFCSSPCLLEISQQTASHFLWTAGDSFGTVPPQNLNAGSVC